MARIDRLLVFGFLAASLTVHAQYTISYQWPNFICATNINCDEGCSACDVPVNESGQFFGTSMIWVGTTACPQPVHVADNALYTNNWGTFVDEDHYGLLSGLATVPVQVDSIVLVHRSEVAGPQRLKILYTSNVAEPLGEIGDVAIDTEFGTTVLTDLGCLDIPAGMAFGSFQLKVQPYQSEGGNWHLDEVRIVGTPCTVISTGIEEHIQRVRTQGPYVDILGRPSGFEPPPGVYIGQRKQVQVF